jgi:hypothetical protein
MRYAKIRDGRIVDLKDAEAPPKASEADPGAWVEAPAGARVGDRYVDKALDEDEGDEEADDDDGDAA